jgi:hypothetical protein
MGLSTIKANSGAKYFLKGSYQWNYLGIPAESTSLQAIESEFHESNKYTPFLGCP